MIVRALRTIQGRYPAGAVLDVHDSFGRRLIEIGVAEEADPTMAEHATGPGAVYKRPPAKTRRRPNPPPDAA